MDRFAEWFARPYVALCFLAFGMAVIPLNDALIKLLGDTMPLGQIVTIRSLMSLALIALFSSGLRRMMGLSRKPPWESPCIQRAQSVMPRHSDRHSMRQQRAEARQRRR